MDDTINYLASHNVKVLKQGQVRDANSNSTNVGATVGMLWIDVEGTQVRQLFYCLIVNCLS